MVAALVRELELRRDYLQGTPLETIYLGGGTPSILHDAELETLLGAVHAQYRVLPDAEITLEANPDDLTAERLEAFRQLGVNRLSIGIQTFDDVHLRWMNRAHTADEALACVPRARAAGFENLSVDLIYGLPADDHTRWAHDLQLAQSLQVPHISAYCLTIEPQTVLGHRLSRGQMQDVPEAFAAEQFEMLVATLTADSYEHYEISNFCRPGAYARHNTNYWRGVPYLGIGPSAHSYDGTDRQHNGAHNANYLRALEAGTVPTEVEVLTPADRINEYLLTSLRTQWGCDEQVLAGRYDFAFSAQQQQQLSRLVQRQLIVRTDTRWQLTTAGKLFADRIASDLFV